MGMNQPQLCIIIDHALVFSDKELCVATLKSISITEELEQYLLYASHLSNKEVETPQYVQLEKVDEEGAIWLVLNDVHIKIHKHIIQLRFPVIFRAFFDYDSLRGALYELLKKLFIPCGSTELSAYPSYWLYEPYEIKNDWHERRLIILQEKICNQCNSYKRTKLNLQLCLSNELKSIKEMTEKRYKGWFIKKLK